MREQLHKDLTSLSQSGKISEATLANLQQGHSDLVALAGDHVQKIRDLEKKAMCCAFRRTPRSTGTVGTETGRNNNDEVTANESQRVKV